MGIFQRTSDIISASVNDLVERFEHPEKMLRHALREMEDSVATVSAAVARSIAAERLLAREQRTHEEQAANWAARAAKAVAAGNDEAARRAIGEKLDHQRLARSLDAELAEARATNRQLRAQVESLRKKHATARRQLSTLVARQAAVGARRQFDSLAPAARSAWSSLARFDYFREKIELEEAEAIALVELDLEADSCGQPEDEFDERNRAVEAELAALRGETPAKPKST